MTTPLDNFLAMRDSATNQAAAEHIKEAFRLAPELFGRVDLGEGGRQYGQGGGRRARSASAVTGEVVKTSDGHDRYVGFEGKGPDDRAPNGYTKRGLIRQRGRTQATA